MPFNNTGCNTLLRIKLHTIEQAGMHPQHCLAKDRKAWTPYGLHICSARQVKFYIKNQKPKQSNRQLKSIIDVSVFLLQNSCTIFYEISNSVFNYFQADGLVLSWLSPSIIIVLIEIFLKKSNHCYQTLFSFLMKFKANEGKIVCSCLSLVIFLLQVRNSYYLTEEFYEHLT